MAGVSFFTAVSFNGRETTFSETLLEKVDSYFYLGGRKAFVIPMEGPARAVLMQGSPEFFATVLKVVSYFTVVLPLIMLLAKAILHSIHRFEIVDARAELERGVVIPNGVAARIEELMEDIQEKNENPAIHWYGAENNLVFGLPDFPGLIFKMAKVGQVRYGNGLPISSLQVAEERFQNMIRAKETCLEEGLDLLVVPGARKIEIGSGQARQGILVEQHQQIHEDPLQQEEYYRRLPGFDDAVRQLATFIEKTGFSDVTWRNIPVLDTAPDFSGRRRVALIDLEEMQDATCGFYGGVLGRRGLIRCLFSEAQIDSVLTVAERHGIAHHRFSSDEIKAKRLQEIAAAANALAV